VRRQIVSDVHYIYNHRCGRCGGEPVVGNAADPPEAAAGGLEMPRLFPDTEPAAVVHNLHGSHRPLDRHLLDVILAQQAARGETPPEAATGGLPLPGWGG
jgi:hypothetical protein